MYDGIYGEKTNESLFLLQQYMLNNYTVKDYNFLQNQYQCDSSTQSILSSQQSQQCCSTYSMMNDYNRVQNERIIDSLQSQISNIKAQEKIINAINPMIGNYNTKEKSIGGDSISENTNKDSISNYSISNYMYKEFLYESELKEIEDKFCFKFEDLSFSNIDENSKIYIESKKIIDRLNNLKLKGIRRIEVIEFNFYSNTVYIYCNNNIFYDIKFGSNEITKKNKDEIMKICNIIIRKNNPSYQKFYEKYKNRIVKDYECEDLSFYEKILQESS